MLRNGSKPKDRGVYDKQLRQMLKLLKIYNVDIKVKSKALQKVRNGGFMFPCFPFIPCQAALGDGFYVPLHPLNRLSWYPIPPHRPGFPPPYTPSWGRSAGAGFDVPHSPSLPPLKTMICVCPPQPFPIPQ